jgi:hypothetical protein
MSKQRFTPEFKDEAVQVVVVLARLSTDLNCTALARQLFQLPVSVELGRQVGLKPLRPRPRLLYNGASGWLELREAARNLLRPIYRHIYPKSTFVYFSKTG